MALGALVCFPLASVAAESPSGGLEMAKRHEARAVLPTNVAPIHYAIEFTPDATTLRFDSHARIDVEVRQATHAITLNAAALEFGAVRLLPSARSSSARVPSGRTPRIEVDSKRETASFEFAEVLAPGQYALDIEYRGRINPNPAGLFALDYTAPDKTSRRALFTQFENTDARRFVPCWDEPGIKATYDLTAIVPASELAVSNMPVAQTTPAGDGLTRVRFQTTPKMSVYLLFFALDDLERVHRQVGKIDLGVIVRRGSTADARFALDASARLLDYYNDYFGIPFPLPKLDLIGGPGVSQFFGAMENWGAIFAFEKDLLIDERTSTLEDRQNVFTGAAH